jgi:transposase InsO family protein
MYLKQMYPTIGTGIICSLFGKSRQAWYNTQQRNAHGMLEETFVLKLVEEIRQEMPRLGTQKLHHMLKDKFKEHNIKIGRDKFYELLERHGYLLRYRKRRPYTTDSRHRFKKYPNLIRDLILTKSGQLWVSDITYIHTGNGFNYLSLITDAYSRKIVGYCLWLNLGSQGAINALEMALAGNKRSKEIIHHSDRGVQYCCNDYVRCIEKGSIQLSMTEKGDPYENAIAERVNGILKTEFGLSNHFTSNVTASESIDKAVNMYNNRRPHSSCDYLTPTVAHDLTGKLHKRWKKSKWSKEVLIEEHTL